MKFHQDHLHGLHTHSHQIQHLLYSCAVALINHIARQIIKMQHVSMHEAAVSLFPSFVRPDAYRFGSSTPAISNFDGELDELALDVAELALDDTGDDNEAAESGLMNELSSVRMSFV